MAPVKVSAFGGTRQGTFLFRKVRTFAGENSFWISFLLDFVLVFINFGDVPGFFGVIKRGPL